ncbi:aldolase/citrate lyase family protein [Actinoallomurus sp. NBC_01490]|uniref:HpcH/HpaI aldolase family protein n=1 Tax=Actinoallomurus sp. NBC_01490 TaxID=2903557 RepID=UPI002E2FEBF0|nr:aldolase/citrate lyase family protein [Actinoallomurus sp. NBC_01490]
MTVPTYLHLSTRSLLMAEHALAGGFDGVVVDMQHGEHDLGSATTLIRSIPGSLSRTLVRVPRIDSGIIGAVLDAGAGGIIAPTVETAAQAAALVAAVKFPPAGGRSLGPLRPGLYAGPSPLAAANDAVRGYAQIESAAGLAALDEILATPGLDGVYIGPADLAVSLGRPPRLDWADGPVRAAIDEVIAGARKAGIAVGIFCLSGAYAGALAEARDVDFVGLGTDVGLLAGASKALIESFRG